MAIGQQIGSLYVNLGADIKEFRDKMDSAGEHFAKVGRDMQRVGATLSAALTVPLTAIGGAATKLATDFEDSLTKIETQVGESRKQVAAWRDDLLAMAPIVGRAPKELSDALFVVTSAGAKANEALGIVESSAKAAAIGLGETQDIARAVTATMQAYRAENLTAARATDILAATVREGNLEAASLAPTLGRVIGIAADMGVSFEEVGASVATFTRLGVSAEEAITGLRGILNAFTQEAGDAAQAAEEMGINMDAIRQRVREKGLIDTLIWLRQLTDQTGVSLKRIIPDTRAYAAALGILQGDGSSAAATLMEIEQSTGLLETAFARAGETARLRFQKALQSLVVAGIKIGEVILPVAAKIADQVAAAAQAFGKLSPAVRTAIVIVAGIAAAVGPALIALGALARAYYAVAVAATAMGATVKTALIKTGVGAAIVALGLMADYIFRNWDKLRVGWGVIWDALVITTLKAVDVMLMSLVSLQNFIPGLAASVVGVRAQIAKLIKQQEAAGLNRALAYYQKQSAGSTDELTDALSDAEKQFAALLDGVVDVGDGLGKNGEKADAVAEIYEALTKESDQLRAKQLVLGSSFNAGAEHVGILERALIALVAEGLDPTSEGLVKIRAQLEGARKQALAFEEIKIRSDAFDGLGTGLREAMATMQATQVNMPAVELPMRVGSRELDRVLDRIREQSLTIVPDLDEDEVDAFAKVLKDKLGYIRGEFELDGLDEVLAGVRDYLTTIRPELDTRDIDAGLSNLNREIVSVAVRPELSEQGIDAVIADMESRLQAIDPTLELDADFREALEGLRSFAQLGSSAGKTAATAAQEVSLLESALSKLIANEEPVDSASFRLLAVWLTRAREEASRLDISEKLQDISAQQRVLGPEFDANAARVRVLEQALISMYQAPGFDESAEGLRDLREQLAGTLEATLATTKPLSTEFVVLVERIAALRREAAGLTEMDTEAALSETLRVLDEDLRRLGEQKETYASRSEYMAARTRMLTEALVQLRAMGIDPNSEAFQTLLEKMEAANDFQWSVKPPDLQEMSSWAQKAGQIAQAISQGFDDAIATFLEGIGSMVAGTKNAKDVSKAVMGTLADMAIRVGKIAIGTGAAIKGIEKALLSLNPYAAIAAGAALIALGSWAKSSLQSAAGGGSAGGGGGFSESTNISNFEPPRLAASYTGEQMSGVAAQPMRGMGPQQVVIANWPDSDGQSVELLPRVLPSGDVEYSTREGTRRARRYGTELI